jgi:tryptophan synthase alpha chain
VDRPDQSRAPTERLEAALRAPGKAGRPALVAFLTAGYPDRARFPGILRAIAEVADAIEVGVPFSDPMADGVTIQAASHAALAQGVTLRGTIQTLREMQPIRVPVVLMGYVNPFLAYGPERLAADAAAAGVCGLIVPDLPHEERELFAAPLAAQRLALVPLVTPVTPPERLRTICAAARGFVYAVTVTGTTGGAAGAAPAAYLDNVRAVAQVPVLAGFGIRDAAQVRALAPHCDGVIVGSALLDALDRGEDLAVFLRALRPDGQDVR